VDPRELLARLETLGNPDTARVLRHHGAQDPVWGVRIGDMKPLIRGVGSDPVLAQALFESGVYDAMYLAALVVNGADLSAPTLDRWARLGRGGSIADSTVPWLAVEHPQAWELALGWLDSGVDNTALSGWATLAGLASTLPDSRLDLELLDRLADRAAQGGQGPVFRGQMGYLVALSVYVQPLSVRAQGLLGALGDRGEAGRVAVAKALTRGPIKKRKTMKC
jgi:hypothetical protein